MNNRTAWLASAIFAAACGGTTPPDSDLTGTLSVVLSDNPGAKIAVANTLSPMFAHHKVFGQNYFHGRLTGTYHIAISRNGRTWTALGGPTQVDLTLQADGETVELHTDATVAAGTYAYLRVVTSGGEAMLDSGAEVSGETLTDPVTLSLGNGDLVVETRLSTPIFVAPGSDMTLGIDLNAESWVSEENVEAGQIPATDIETAISVTPHERLPALVVPRPKRRT